MEITSVLEIEAYAYSDRAPPDLSGDPDDAESNAAWDAYFQACMKDAGLDHLEPVEPGSTMFSVDTVTRPHDVAIIVAEHLSNFEIPTDPTLQDIDELIGSDGLEGGFLIRRGEETILHPGCCADLGSIRDWELALRERPTDWESLWVGHDRNSAELKFDEARYQLRIGAWDSGIWDVEVDGPADELEKAIAEARKTLEELAARIAPSLPATIPEAFREVVAQRLAGVPTA